MSVEEQVKYLLDQLADQQAKIDWLKLQHDTYIKNELGDEHWTIIERARRDRDLQIEEAEANTEALKAEIAKLIQLHGESVAGQYMVAKWCKPRVKWNDDGLVGYALTHPELLAFRVEGQPSVTIAFKQQKGGSRNE